ncbi:hypothetical protein SORBI_3003G154900 [Sorghum bicolor]|uniref:Uncharacterized protein n=2 Tax=Sorghum bicolor TaxID=4558 RepID=A0A1B6Q3D9_SORBI|nr:hypothetical protein SORBI_3003G154900 [Sorghum bicolor]
MVAAAPRPRVDWTTTLALLAILVAMEPPSTWPSRRRRLPVAVAPSSPKATTPPSLVHRAPSGGVPAPSAVCPSAAA